MADLGGKHECPDCGTKFYDLGRPQPLCPRCGRNVAEDAEAKKVSKSKKKAAADDEDEPAEAADDSEEE